jgi:hypothetical protein
MWVPHPFPWVAYISLLLGYVGLFVTTSDNVGGIQHRRDSHPQPAGRHLREPRVAHISLLLGYVGLFFTTPDNVSGNNTAATHTPSPQGGICVSRGRKPADLAPQIMQEPASAGATNVVKYVGS